MMGDHGTRVIIYNLWEDDQGELELDFDTNRHDIQIRGVNRDEKKIEMARQFPNSRHFLTYRHSLRSYASILYLKLPRGFRIVLRGKDVEHHNIINDLMLTQEITYRPQPGADGVPKDPNMVAIVTLGFVKDAKDHIDVQGFNVYHKNRLIKPFWRVWNAAGSDGRGVIGVLEANFVEPAHDKQGFERTTVLSRLEQRLVQMQKTFWSTYCHKIGYAPRRHKKLVESSPDYSPYKSSKRSNKFTSSYKDKHSTVIQKQMFSSKSSSSEPSLSISREESGSVRIPSQRMPNGSTLKASPAQKDCSLNSQSFSLNSNNSEVELNRASNGITGCVSRSRLKEVASNGDAHASTSDTRGRNLEVENCGLKSMEASFLHDLGIDKDKNGSIETLVNEDTSSSLDACGQSQCRMENHALKKRLKELEDSCLHDLQFERDRCRSLAEKLKESEAKIEEMNKEQEALIDIFSEERNRRDSEEENLRKKLKDASNTIHQLLDKVRQLEKLKSNCKAER
ncbi:Microrchidia-like protein [Thalictrum thalictroides]|uniref:Microrchidia-like protein n=1 Tax=Thalictrum thalictroides TaxID=46969 RepID=A0A7J6WEM1_THATH|nr:Microrchidia-like protein [Thalictrum thalictroides]